MKERFPKAQLRGVAGSGVSPVEEVMAKRADAVPINRVPWVAMGRKLKQLAVLPKDNNCQNSTEKAAPVGMAIDKNQDGVPAVGARGRKGNRAAAQEGRGARRRYDEVAAGAHATARVPGRRATAAWISTSASSPTTGASSRTACWITLVLSLASGGTSLVAGFVLALLRIARPALAAPGDRVLHRLDARDPGAGRAGVDVLRAADRRRASRCRRSPRR